MNSTEVFDFGGADAMLADPVNDRVVTMPRGVHRRHDLLEAYRQQLSLPAYFGDNWDALSECLRDLSWVKQRRVVVVHHELPHFEPTVLAAYLAVLGDAVRSWQPADEHQLVVSFPPAARSVIETTPLH